MSIKRLPPEILGLILFEAVREESGKPSTAASYRLLGVCFQWKSLVETTSGFWTNVYIVFKANRNTTLSIFPTPTPDQYLEHLDLQLQRAESQLIDVYLSIDVDAERAGHLFGLIFHRAPFCRWRSLEVLDANWNDYTLPIARHNDGFVNLEYMKVHYRCKPELLRLIDHTVTSKLRVFRGYLEFEKIQEHCPNILSGISEMELGMSSNRPFSPPPNVVDLTLPYLQLNDLCHVEHLTLTHQQSVMHFVNFDWTNLVSLNFAVSEAHAFPPTQHISFPRLERLFIHGTFYIVLAYFSAPRLTDLQVDRAFYPTKLAINRLEEALSCSFFTLSPSEVIEILFPLNKMTLNTLVRAFSETKRLILHFEDEYRGWETIRGVFCDWRIGGEIAMKGGVEAGSPDPTMFMKKLVSLDLQLKWMYEEGMRENWRARVAKVLQDTQGTKLKEIRCTWKGEPPLELDRSELMKDVPKG
ncbi:hypothetical protein FRC14_004333 [Serendipita sp. 396]|nr:hypothetical protein FRC14_004333 [Serendipita sp. 396]KAG8787664.1 hypothetical protein FRC15_008537 [Serendipita sp. 397]KAG8803092.1 hypothetical protein FRC16_007212 [Serendipita sp. 398]KAG8879525.1 hypothetical protein FRC20_000097 [Serendipita sp. 405]